MQQIFSIICDDIRFEQNNKISLIGVYSDLILVPKLPFTFAKICLAQEFHEAKVTKQVRLNLKGPKLNVPPIVGVVSDKKPEIARIKLPICVGPVTFEQEGEYSFETYFDDDEEPAFIKKFHVRLRSSSEKPPEKE
jgi:hypothetical protein